MLFPLEMTVFITLFINFEMGNLFGGGGLIILFWVLTADIIFTRHCER